ncbi:MAG: glucose-1-phosphate adenylyltransferase [Gammaproteobacteria bacterium]|nr:MAG: glucose-1-phosphate adenylyltransferase [Gammaproteobacteria bacterium]
MMERVLAIILAGGEGSRLYPLTANRSKPAVPFGGKYRIIDFTLSNCLHSQIRRVLVLTQYKSHSLLKHLRDAWSVYAPEIGEFITAIPAQMQVGSQWYAGTADAVYQNLSIIERLPADEILVLSGDHIYRMDYAAMIRAHRASGAEATIACIRLPLDQGSAFGIVCRDNQGRAIGFREKPRSPMPMEDDPEHCLASMGIYVFKREALIEHLRADHEHPSSSHDFGRDLLPEWIRHGHVHTYEFGHAGQGRVTPDGYWRDVGTIDAYYEANMDLLRPVPPLNLYQHDWPVRSYHRPVPPCRTGPAGDGTAECLENTILGSGSIITGAHVRDSILFYLVHIEAGADIEGSILFDDVHVGQHARLRRCIVDKHVHIPPGMHIGFDLAEDRKRFHVSSSGITVIPEGFRFSAS